MQVALGCTLVVIERAINLAGAIETTVIQKVANGSHGLF
jgi:hypothetical protein